MHAHSSIHSPEAAVSPRLFSVSDACKALGGMGRTWLYEQMRDGKIRSVKLGTRTMIPATEIDRIIVDALDAAA